MMIKTKNCLILHNKFNCVIAKITAVLSDDTFLLEGHKTKEKVIRHA